jgi:hypothetical protein
MMMMDFSEIKHVSIVNFLSNIGIRPVRDYSGYALYHAPYRKDIHPSFKVSKSKNRWYDLSLCEGGDIIDLGRRIYNTNDVVDVARRIMSYDNKIIVRSNTKVMTSNPNTTGARYNISEGPMVSPQLLSYLATRGISLDLARKYCVEVHYRMGGKNYYAIGFKNIREGYEVRSPIYKGCLGPKDITLIHQQSNNLDCMVFEGFIDFLSYLTLDERCDFTKIAQSLDFMVLNSVSNLKRALPWLMQYQTVTCCFDNDDAGRKAVDILSEVRSGVYDVSNVYSGYKDLNDFLNKKPYCP